MFLITRVNSLYTKHAMFITATVEICCNGHVGKVMCFLSIKACRNLKSKYWLEPVCNMGMLTREKWEKKWRWEYNKLTEADVMLFFTQTLKKGGSQQDGQKEKEEIHSLQEQLAALKEITVSGAVIRLHCITSCYLRANLYLWLHTDFYSIGGQNVCYYMYG